MFLLISLLFVVLTIGSAYIKPDLMAPTMGVISNHGYPSEVYNVTTQDGYILTVHRIPYCKNNPKLKDRQPVFLQHGLFGSSTDWLLIGNESLAFILSDAGYDVWLGNARGSVYSLQHLNFTTNDNEFWDFSWHEMGKYDLPAVFNLINSKTNKVGEIIYIGHSMGTSMFFVYASLYEKSNDIIKMMVALAPITYMMDTQSPLKFITQNANNIDWVADNLGSKQFTPTKAVVDKLLDYDCNFKVMGEEVCRHPKFMFVGFDEDQFPSDFLPMIKFHSSGGSTKTVVHYAQEVSNGKFQYFDYGTNNAEFYGSKDPPLYNVSKINIPIFIISSKNDWLSGEKDCAQLYDELPNKIGHYIVKFKKFNHIDYLFAKDVVKSVYNPLLLVLKTYHFDFTYVKFISYSSAVSNMVSIVIYFLTFLYGV